MQPLWQRVRIDGLWYEEGVSRQRTAFLRHISEQDIEVVDSSDGAQLVCCSLDDLKISSRLGNTSRQLYFQQGQKFESLDNETIDQLLIAKGHGFSRFIYLLESRWQLVFIALILFVGFGYGMVQYGVPAVANKMAFWLPSSVADQAASHTLRLLDETVLSPSKLPRSQQDQLLTKFKVYSQQVDLPITIQFRHGGNLGANAFALPDGTIVFTDELVKLAERPEELIAVLLHEIGHVAHRHGAQSVMQNSLLVVMAMAFVGDTSGIAELFMGMPIVMMQSAYSRDFEREADRFALRYMHFNQIAGSHLADLLDRIELNIRCRAYFSLQVEDNSQSSLCDTPGGLQQAQQKGWLISQATEGAGWQSYLDSHPDNAERRAMLVNEVAE
ncbi:MULTISPECIES: M48 family metallopeptidase [unclassified Methylophaga]|jgi:Zn-dependent protease with chaperone function|uniref:M48 family metallopeptidase n=1 Tax=unclassified Methylophaga TaxID=2629249 RepID=UPI000C949DF6|nr:MULTISPECIES: M48 family metallopeptidase [unclassified Methylophaga]MAK66255.1 peptidase M48 Ste24p [Methylophaga sp.]MAY17451.1 peptidase M48 Ste24p [Methylophaga sp.]MBN47393.1 peptidase M48 Ste24p [Methylophaga sp.]HAO25126.1 peptidase M48 Ste24p [Methylophaga sp.]|tara:strand:- start:60677 stop:61834 length:1158 start_codon:yes stop_codon:yes gene_type:complete